MVASHIIETLLMKMQARDVHETFQPETETETFSLETETETLAKLSETRPRRDLG
jgi:hypothetical protein